MCKVTNRVTFAVFVFMCAIIMQTDGHREEKKCYSIHVRNNVSGLEKLQGCTVVEGYVQIVLMDKTSEKDFVNISFPELREITQHLLVFRVKGLKSLGQLFPNLALIRGTSLFANAALAIYENSKLQEIGLRSLTHIMEGSVIINKNFNLCYASTIDWGAIMKSNSTSQSYYEVIVTQNKEEKECNSQNNCKSIGCERNLCWTKDHCQLLKLNHCHPLCAGGCWENNSASACYACKGVLTSAGECVATCPPDSFEHLKRTCVSKDECLRTPVRVNNRVLNYTYFAFNNSCISDCPSNYRKDTQNSTPTCVECNDDCRKDCPGSRITTVSESKQMQSCTHILGSLAIVGITGNYNSGIENALEENLGMIEEITGHLQIIHSHALLSLNFLRNLRVIRGEHVNSTSLSNAPDEQTQHTLIVKDNKNLQQLWDWEKKPGKEPFQIKSGKIFFHFNPKLCTSEIEKLVKVAKLPSYSNLEVSRESNGYQTTCNPIPLNVTVEKRASNSIILALHLSSNNSTGGIGRFMVFYKESDGEPLNDSKLYESVSECGDTQWRMTNYAQSNNSNGTIYMLLPHLEPAVQYIYFVRAFATSLSMSTSPIQTVSTKPSQPSAPLDFHVTNVTDSEMSLSWKPPSHPHGIITHYVIKGYWQTDKSGDLLERDYCQYKMQKNERLTSKPILSTTPAPPTSEGKCKCDNETEKDNFQYCNSFEHVTDIHFMKPENGMETCDAYIYGIVNANFQKLKNLHEQNSMDGSLDSKIAPTASKMEPVTEAFPLNNTLGADGKYDAFRIEVDASVRQVNIVNLRHFSEYIVLISACQDDQISSYQDNDEDFVACSRETILTTRTEKKQDADRVNANDIEIYVYNQTANITWFEPNPVNSFVHSYILEYRSIDVENSKYTEVCITRKQFRDSNGTYSIVNLGSGHYDLRLKAISLAGDGAYAIRRFSIEEASKDYLSIVIGSVIVVVVIVCILVAFLYYWRLQISKNRILFASVNPRYEPVYVEDHWEVPRENLTLVKQLGRGTFGSVHEGILQPDNIRCAVKTVTAVSGEDNATFLKEATLMKEFHKAFHIVRLIGVVSKGTPVYVIMELMELGDLKSFLLRKGCEFCDHNNTLPANMIFKMAAEIADGMAFLEAKKFVHRDLAARNCMVAGDTTIKIGDFGLARDIYETDYYRKGDKGTLPIRWMAPESIRDGIFTSNSDVWSYGVVLWEITTLAQMPYHPRTNEEVIKYVQSGQILDIPSNANELMRPLMRCCWRWHASHRPKFAQILKLLDSYVDHRFRKVSFFHNGEDPSDPANVVPCKVTTDECYLYTDENDEINLYLGQSPSTSGSTASGVKFQRYDKNGFENMTTKFLKFQSPYRGEKQNA